MAIAQKNVQLALHIIALLEQGWANNDLAIIHQMIAVEKLIIILNISCRKCVLSHQFLSGIRPEASDDNGTCLISSPVVSDREV